MKHKSLKTSILVWFGSVLFFILFFFNVFFYVLLTQNLQSQIELKLSNSAELLESTVLPMLDSESLQTRIFNEYADSTGFQIVNIQTNTILASDSKSSKKHFLACENQDVAFFIIDEIEYKSALYCIRQDNTPLMLIVYQEDVDQGAESIIGIIIVLTVIVLLSILFFTSKLVDKVLIPIHTMTNTANQITVNNLDTSIPIRNEYKEMDKLAKTFNSMIERLKEGILRIERFNSDVSHEFQTPLTVINGEVDVILKKERTSEEYIQTLKTIKQESGLLTKIVHSLLMLNYYDKNKLDELKKSVDIDVILLNCIEKLNSKAIDKNIKLTLSAIEPIAVQSDESLVYSLFHNIIDNAIKYSKPQSAHIDIRLYKDEGIHFIVEDNGIGIAEEDLLKITHRFYRVDKARSRRFDGFGLGLSLVKQIVEIHNGTLRIDSKLNEGTKVEVIL